MSNPSLFKWRHFAAEVILCSVRWYLRYALSYRDMEELLQERSARVDHTTVLRWVQRYAPELDKRCRPQLKVTNDSYRVGVGGIPYGHPTGYYGRSVRGVSPAFEALQ